MLRLTLRAAAKATRLAELVHRAVPYPLLLVTEQGEHVRTVRRPQALVAGRDWQDGVGGRRRRRRVGRRE